MSRLLEGKVCVITGAGKGLGRSFADIFYQQGANLALITRSHEDVEALRKELNSDGQVLAVCGDVSNLSDVKNFVAKTVSHFGSIDVLVNNAGMRFRKKFLDITDNELSRVFDVNVKSMFYCCQEVIPHMLNQGQGKIINLSSVAGTLGLPELSGYVASKAAVIGLTKSIALEFSENNIQINALAPGFCKTSYFDSFRENSELYDFTVDRTPMRRWGESDEIANAGLFLASRMSDFVTGEVLNVDGGWSAW